MGGILDAASDQRKPLAAIHAFALSNVIRRPIVILEGRRRHIDVSDPTSMFGVYLPLLWRTAPAECWQKPLFISHDNGHYWAVVTGSQEGSDKLADLLRSSPFGLDQRRAQVRFQSPCVKDIEIAILMRTVLGTSIQKTFMFPALLVYAYSGIGVNRSQLK